MLDEELKIGGELGLGAVQGTNKQPPFLLGHDHALYDDMCIGCGYLSAPLLVSYPLNRKTFWLTW